jgi:transposase
MPRIRPASTVDADRMTAGDPEAWRCGRSQDFSGRLPKCIAGLIFHELYRQNENIVEVGCWSHARRKFFDALPSDKLGATRGLVLIGRLYEINARTRKSDGAGDAAADAACSTNSRRDLCLVDEVMQTDDDKSPLRLALNYLRNHREPLTQCLNDGRLRLDNNLSELALRRQVIGRKNWLFRGSDDGAHWNTTIVSLIASCELHGIEPWAYLRDVLTLLPTWPQQEALALAPKYWNETRGDPEVARKLHYMDLVSRARELDAAAVESVTSQAPR